MKKRIKVDSSLLSMIIFMTGFLFWFRNLYPSNIGIDNVLDFFGMITVLKGNLLRMSARGHKKAHSQKSQSLVTSGPYTLVRNPMYLGSCLMGSGFVMIVWPWWSLPLFVWLFYMRFRIQVKKEEEYLEKHFGKEFLDYCKKVPRAFPRFSTAWKTKTNIVFNLDESFSTKESRGLIGWPILAILLETFQEMIVYGATDIWHTTIIFALAMLTFAIGFIVMYQSK